eukprot:555327-Rhodomonas_salina.2
MAHVPCPSTGTLSQYCMAHHVRSPYAMSGTDIAYSATLSYAMSGTGITYAALQTLCLVRSAMVLQADARNRTQYLGTTPPTTLRPRYAMSGTDRAYAVLSPYRTTPIALCPCYAVSGTDIATEISYAATLCYCTELPYAATRSTASYYCPRRKSARSFSTR